MPLWWQQNIESELLYPDAILRLIPYVAKTLSEDRRTSESKHDPITATAIVFLTCPLQLGLTEVGAMLFQGHASLVLPYTLMSERQKSFVRDCLDRREEWNVYNDCLLFRRPKGEPQRTLGQACVLSSLCGKILSASTDRDVRQRLALCNIILQRVQGYVTIEKQVQRELNEWLAGRGDLRIACDIKTGQQLAIAN